MDLIDSNLLYTNIDIINSSIINNINNLLISSIEIINEQENSNKISTIIEQK